MCNLAAQGALTAQGSIQAVGGERTDGAGNGTVGHYLLQAVPEPDPGHRAGIEAAAVMLGTDKSRGYCVEMICADFLAGANLENGNSEVLLQLVVRFFKFLPREAVVSPSRLARRRCESNGSQTSSHPTRSRAAAGVTSGWLEVPIVWHDVESGSSPQTVSQPFRPRFGRESDHTLHGECHTQAHDGW